jgi:hypothetical protein
MKLYPYPQPRIALHRRENSSGHAKSYWNHSTHVIRWMGRNALRRIRDFDAAGQSWPTVDELEAWIMETHQKALAHCTDADYAAKAQDAAVFALSAYDPAEYDRRVQRARNGGKASGHKKGARGKRPPVHKPEDLDGLEHLSKTEQAERLGCSPATIGRLRAERARMQAEPDFLDSVMADIDAERANSVRANKPEPVAADSVRANNPIVSIATGKPIQYLEQVLLDIRAEREQNAYDHASDMLAVIGL